MVVLLVLMLVVGGVCVAVVGHPVVVLSAEHPRKVLGDAALDLQGHSPV